MGGNIPIGNPPRKRADVLHTIAEVHVSWGVADGVYKITPKNVRISKSEDVLAKDQKERRAACWRTHAPGSSVRDDSITARPAHEKRCEMEDTVA